MTEYWVSQGKKWCDFCKIFIANNPSSIRNHDLGQKHKDNVAQRLATMRKDNIAKDKAEKAAASALEQIEAKAKRSYQKDVENLKEAGDARALDFQEDSKEKWDYDSATGYYYNSKNGLHYDSNSGFYYSDSIGKWVTQPEAYAAVKASSGETHKTKPSVPAVRSDSPATSGPPPGRVVSASLNPTRSVKGAASKVTVVNKRKRDENKPKVLTQEDKAALKAREAAKKRVEEREKGLLGLYKR
ncbi:Zinc finger protein ZOP1 [Linum grandiflorum]